MRLFALLLSSLLLFSCSSTTEDIYVGTGSPDGMFKIQLDKTTGKLTKTYQQSDVKSPGFLTLSPDKNFLYTVCANNKVRAYTINSDGSLTFLSEASSTGKGPCHIEVSKTNTSVVVANYGSGDTTVISVDDGKLISPSRNHSHKNFKPSNASKRQTGPHAHNVKMSPDGKYV
ncbi:MAG: lactonase family protein, partial [Lentisphaeraceae bacterium]|nr:lactonase family protein [Lentisphaeraceae bacterium]